GENALAAPAPTMTTPADVMARSCDSARSCTRPIVRSKTGGLQLSAHSSLQPATPASASSKNAARLIEHAHRLLRLVRPLPGVAVGRPAAQRPLRLAPHVGVRLELRHVPEQ